MTEATSTITSFDNTLREAEAAAAAAARAAASLTARVRKLRNAASKGDLSSPNGLGRVRKELTPAEEDLSKALSRLRQTVDDAVAWPGGDDEEERSFKTLYADELRAAAETRGLQLRELDDQLTCFPSIVRISEDGAVELDRKKLPTIRPSVVADKLLQNKRRSDRYGPEKFLEALYLVYQPLAKLEVTRSLKTGIGPIVDLSKIFKLLTALPTAKKGYNKVDFARDLFSLEDKGVRRTRKGAEVELSGSSGTRQAGGFAFIGPEGQEGRYTGVSFRTES